MAIKVELFDGTILEFPDDTPTEVIDRTAKQVTLQKQPPKEEPGVLEQLLSAPKEVVKGAASGLVQAVGGLGALPYAAARYAVPELKPFEETSFGKAITGAEQYLAPSDEGYITQVAGGLGSLASMIGPQALLRGVGTAGRLATGLAPKAATPFALGQTSGLGVEEARQRAAIARAEGEAAPTAGEELAALALGVPIGLTELLPIERLFKGLDTGLSEGFKYTVANRVKRALQQGGIEGAQEVASGLMQDLSQKGIYNPNLEVGQSMFDELTVGGGVGAIAQTGLDILFKRRIQDAYNTTQRKKAEEELKKRTDEILKKQQEQIATTKEQLGIKEEQPLMLPAPAEKIEVKEETDPLQNPLGTFKPDQLQEGYLREVNKIRDDQGMAKVKELSIEDIADAGAPRGEIDRLISGRLSEQGVDVAKGLEAGLTMKDIENLATEKNIDTATPGFTDFVRRTTGVEGKLSPVQTLAVFESLSKLPAAPQLQILPEGTNATRFTQAQYDKTVKSIKDMFPETGQLGRTQVIQEVKDYSGLENTRDAESLLDAAIRNGEFTTVSTRNFLTVDQDGKQVGIAYPTRKTAERAAQARGLSVREKTSINIALPEAEKPLPGGPDIRKGQFKEGEVPEAFEIKSDQAVLATAKTEEEAAAKAERLQTLRKNKANGLLGQINSIDSNISKSQQKLESMEADGKADTIEYRQLAAKIAANNANLEAQKARLNTQAQQYLAPVTVTPKGTKPVARQGFTLFEQGKPKATFPTQQAAEEAALTGLETEQLQALVNLAPTQKGLQAKRLGKMARDELARRMGGEGPAGIKIKPAEGRTVAETEAKLADLGIFTPKFKQQVDELEKKLRPVMDKLGLKDLRLNIVRAIQTPMGEADGMYAEKLVTIALNADNPIRTLRHEAIHALKELGAFTDAQWKVLEKMAKENWLAKYGIAQRYKGLTQSEQIEEAIADAFSDFDQTKPPAGLVGALFNKIKKFFDALGNAMRGMGFQTAEDVFANVEKGVKLPEEITPARGPKYSKKLAYHAGDLGYARDTTLGRMAGGRSTGHLGTGVYFTSSPSRIFGREDREVQEVDLSDYKLARPANEDFARTLYRSLKEINNLSEDVDVDSVEFELLVDRLRHSLYQDKLNPKDIEKAIVDSVKEARELLKTYIFESNYIDSASTRVMKKLGYEGIDNRHIPEFDNTEYGTVVYVENFSPKEEEGRKVATGKEEKQAEEYFKKNDILPYTPEKISSVFVEADKAKFSIKREGKYGDHDILGIPVNKNGTVTLYYPTDNETAREIIRTKKLIPTKGSNRIYLTNESSAPKVMNEPGNMDQPLGGANVLVQIDPALLNIDQEFDDGRKDFFIPLTEGQAFINKMKQTKLFTLEAARDKGFNTDRTLTDVGDAISSSVEEFMGLSKKDRRERLKQAREVLKREHNIGTLLGENGKLEKTRVGDYGLTYEGQSVASLGLGLASAQRLNTQERLTTCPQSAICEGLCLGETSGQNLLYGGSGKFRSGPRLSQYLKTEALMMSPSEFGVILANEIDSFRKWAKDNNYQTAVRLNVTSDIPPKVFKGIIDAFPDVMFYDYTKLASNTIAPNHHLTYSSTGASQVVNGEKVFNPYSNWDRMVQRMLGGQNVAMAFTSRTDMPSFVQDEKTGEVFEVWNGDNYDARFLDPKTEDGKGLIIGLTNKDKTTKPENAAKEYNGFFLDYNKARDGDTLVIKDQSSFKGKPKESPVTITTKKPEKYALKAPNTKEFKEWFGDSKVVDENGEPLVVYHGGSFTETDPRGPIGVMWWSVNKEDAQSYADQQGGEVTSAYLSVKNPRVLKTGEEMNSVVRLAMKNKTYDGAYDPETGDWVVWNPTQVKSAISNKGTFDSTVSDIRYSLKVPTGFSMNDLPRDTRGNVDTTTTYTLPENTILFHGANKDRADEIKRVGRILQARPSVKTGGGLMNEGNLVWFGDEDIAKGHSKQEIDVISTALKGKKEPGEVFETVTEKPYKLIGRMYKMNAEEADAVSDALQLPDYKRMKEGDSISQAAYRAHDSSPVTPSYRTDQGRMTAPYPIILKALGYDGYFDTSGIAIIAEKGVRLGEKGARMERFSLKAPNTKEFKEWFGDSKIVNEDGTPKVMYHGRRKDFGRFDIERSGETTDWGYYGKGISFTADKYTANAYAADDPGANVVVAYLSIQNPYVWPDDRPVSRSKAESEQITKELMAEGYDGIVIGEGKDLEVTAFKPNQVKTVFTEKPTLASEDIRYSLKESIDPDTATAIDRTTTTRQKEGYADRFLSSISSESRERAYAGIVNKYIGIEKRTLERAELLGDQELLADQSAIAAALFSDRAAGVAASSFRNGVPVYEKGFTNVSDLNGTVKGLIPIFEPLMKYNDPYIFQMFQYYAAVQRGQRLTAEGREKLFNDPDDIKRAQALASQYSEFEPVFKEYQKYNQGLVKFMKDTGVISDKEAQVWTQNWDYIPFYRQMEGEVTVGPKVFSAIAGVAKPKKLKGGEAQLADFMETVVRNARAAIESGMKNIAAQRAVRDVLDAGLAVEVPASEAIGTDIVTLKENGITKHYRVADPMVVESMKGLNLPQLPFLDILAKPAEWLRNLVTKDPGFIMANLLRDSVQAWVTTGQNMTPIVDTFKQYGAALVNASPEVRALAQAGLFTGYDFSGDVKATAREVEKELRQRSGNLTFKERALWPLSKIWSALEKGSTASDVATRAEVYKRVLKETGNEAEALYQAMEVLNFSRRGSSAVIRILTAVVPFMNARIQGLDVLYRAGFGKMATSTKEMQQKAFMFRSMYILSLSCLYWALASDSEEYKTAEPEARDNNWIIGNVRIPIPFEIGVLFKVFPERILETAFGQDTGKDLKESIFRNLSSTLAFNPIPQAVIPLIENVANYSFFTGQPIIGKGMENVAPKFQATSGTSLFAQRVGDLTNQSPIMIDNLVRGYTGTLGTYFVMLTDAIMRGEGDPTKATMKAEQLPVIKRFFASEKGTGTITAYYDLKNQVDEATRTINFLERTGKGEDLKAYYEEKGAKLMAVKPYIQALDKDMTTLRETRQAVLTSRMDPDRKREILDNIRQAEINLTSRIQFLKKQMS